MNGLKTIEDSLKYLSDDWRNSHKDFLVIRHLTRFAEGLCAISMTKPPSKDRLPYFKEEITPSMEVVSTYFELHLLPLLNKEIISESEVQAVAQAIKKVPFEYILILLGQRFTSASIKDVTALPPEEEVLLRSCLSPFNEQICHATRAWEKHIGRSEDKYWGRMEGSPREKDAKIKVMIRTMLAAQTWWNVFFHYKHGLVYEIRVPSGHGIRWNKDGTQLIGFLEPFL